MGGMPGGAGGMPGGPAASAPTADEGPKIEEID